jgi:hypothetical protein
MEAFGFMFNLAQSFGSDSVSWFKTNAAWANRQRCGSFALLARRVGHSIGTQGPADLDTAAQLPFIALLGLTLAATWYAVYALATNSGSSTRELCIWRRSQTCRLCTGHCRWRFASLDCLLGLGQTFSRSHPCTRTTFFLCASLFALANLARKRMHFAVLRCPRHHWPGTFRRPCIGDDFGGRRCHCDCFRIRANRNLCA